MDSLSDCLPSYFLQTQHCYILPKMVNFIIHVFSCILLPCWIIFLSKRSFFLTGGVDIRPLRIQRKTQSTRTHLAPFVNRTSLWNELAKPSLVPKPVVWTRRTLHQFLPLTRNSFFGATSHFRPLSTEQALVGNTKPGAVMLSKTA